MMQAKIKCPCCGHSITVNAVNPDEVRFYNGRPYKAGEVIWLDPKEVEAFMPAFDHVFDAMDSAFKRVFNPKLWKRK